MRGRRQGPGVGRHLHCARDRFGTGAFGLAHRYRDQAGSFLQFVRVASKRQVDFLGLYLAKGLIVGHCRTHVICA